MFKVFAQQNHITLREFNSLAIHQCFSLLKLKEGWKNRWRIKNETKSQTQWLISFLFEFCFHWFSNRFRMLHEWFKKVKEASRPINSLFQYMMNKWTSWIFYRYINLIPLYLLFNLSSFMLLHDMFIMWISSWISLFLSIE